jgi:hypothetical protein
MPREVVPATYPDVSGSLRRQGMPPGPIPRGGTGTGRAVPQKKACHGILQFSRMTPWIGGKVQSEILLPQGGIRMTGGGVLLYEHG